MLARAVRGSDASPVLKSILERNGTKVVDEAANDATIAPLCCLKTVCYANRGRQRLFFNNSQSIGVGAEAGVSGAGGVLHASATAWLVLGGLRSLSAHTTLVRLAGFGCKTGV